MVNLEYEAFRQPTKPLRAVNNHFFIVVWHALAAGTWGSHWVALLGNERIYERIKLYKDGVITARNTFQKYFMQEELQRFYRGLRYYLKLTLPYC